MKDLNRITIRDLYPHFNERQLHEAETNFRRYVAILWRIHSRLKAEGRSQSSAGSPDLTRSPESSIVPTERSIPKTNH